MGALTDEPIEGRTLTEVAGAELINRSLAFTPVTASLKVIEMLVSAATLEPGTGVSVATSGGTVSLNW